MDLVAISSGLPPAVPAGKYGVAFLCGAGLDLVLPWIAPFCPLHQRQGLLLILTGGVAWILIGVPLEGAWGLPWAGLVLAGVLGAVLASLRGIRGRVLGGLGWRRGRTRRRHPDRPLILVADPHWRETLVGLEETARQHPEADWLFLGDMFDVWVALPALESELQKGFLAWIDERRAAGCWVGIWSGNRDYFLHRHAHRLDLVGEGIGGGLTDEGLAWEHGDLVHPGQVAYRVWLLVSRGLPGWLVAFLLPRGLGRRLMAALERSLRQTGTAYRSGFPREAFAAVVDASPAAVFITGHFHVQAEHGKGISLPWAHEGCFMVWHRGVVQPLKALQPDVAFDRLKP